MLPLTLTNPYLVSALPDGSVISWLRVPGDPSSAAVAFVRRQADEVWLSCACCGPVGMDTIDHYPVTVLSFGVSEPVADTAPELRLAACEMAVELEVARIAAGSATGLSVVLGEAAALETYLADSQLPLF